MTYILNPIIDEVIRTKQKFPTWPNDPIHALAIIGEKFGELTRAVVQQTYEPHKNELGEIRKEAIQLAAMAIRFYESLESYEYMKSGQHKQTL